MLDNGRAALTASTDLYLGVLRSINKSGEELPIIIVTGDQNADLELAEEVRREWEAIRLSIPEEARETHKQEVAQAVSLAVDALNYLEDTADAGAAHELIHRTSLLRNGLYGCTLWAEGRAIWTDCPVRVSHLCFGVSAEMTTVWNCSICNQRFDVCSHDPDTYYSVEASRNQGLCSLCRQESCEHIDGSEYQIMPRAVASAISNGAIAFVARPRYPRARVTEMCLIEDPSEAQLKLATSGDLQCNVCLLDCQGMKECLPS
ncbi:MULTISPECIES: hypothetical protein [Plantibacter]|uniref:hypothetical protein n=1 Tax=Plantibacter TaxID=190323 RepID=UPI0025516C28|nr:hypothetical protein [Plantibacter sp. lyk4-40-MEA-4]